jgi:L,D-peptidoglycan transpeptidase YkuD (ErfK/YbiS/YcfS/YnhG family)
MKLPNKHRSAGGLSMLRVRARPATPAKGLLLIGPRAVPVALGRGGIRADKREADGGTPRGTFRLLRLWWRPDRSSRPRTLLPVRRIKPDDAWSEDPSHRRYNRWFKMPHNGAGDRLWREDRLYDLIIELDHNTRPRVAGRGSAVFIHVARPGLAPTAGCVAMPARTLRRILERLGPNARIQIQ